MNFDVLGKRLEVIQEKSKYVITKYVKKSVLGAFA